MSRKVTDFFKQVNEALEKENNIVGESHHLQDQGGEENRSNNPLPCPKLENVTPVISDSVLEAFHPPLQFSFPKTKFCTRERSCQVNWFQRFKWLHYDMRLGVYYYQVIFLDSQRNSSNFFHYKVIIKIRQKLFYVYNRDFRNK